MLKLANQCGTVAIGSAVVSLTVLSSGVSILVINAIWLRRKAVESGAATCSIVYLTSAAVTGLPSWKRASRSLKVHTPFSSTSQLSASSPRSRPSLP